MPRWLAHTIVAAVFVAAIAAAFWRAGYEWNWSAVWDYRQKFLQGWLVTVALSIAALAASVAVGAGAAALLRSGRPLLEAAGRTYVEVIRGTPLLVQLLIGFYVVASAVGIDNRYLVGVAVLALFSGAYMAEIFRGGLAAIPAADASDWSILVAGVRALGLHHLLEAVQGCHRLVDRLAGEALVHHARRCLRDRAPLACVGDVSHAGDAIDVLEMHPQVDLVPARGVDVMHLGLEGFAQAFAHRIAIVVEDDLLVQVFHHPVPKTRLTSDSDSTNASMSSVPL